MISLERGIFEYLRLGDFARAYECLKIHWGKEKDYSVVEKFRKKIKNPLELKQTYDLTARDVFDDFMISLEWDRPPKEQFWLPRREKLFSVCQALQSLEDGELDELFLNMPPRVGKTTLVMFFSLWVCLRNPEKANLYCSYTESVVKVFYSGLLEVLNDPYTYRWDVVFPNENVARTDAKDLLLDINRKKRYATFTGRSLYGTLNGACDCNGYLISDDLHSGIEEALNTDRLNAAWYKVDNNLLPRAKEGAKRLWIGTRWSNMDSFSRRMELLENDERFANVRWKALNTPALDENDESNFDYKYGGGFSTTYFRQRRASFERNSDMASWLAQYQGEPIERAGAVFEPDDMRYFNGDLPETDRVYMYVDPAWGGGDYVASPVCCQSGDDIYIIDVVYSNLDKTKTWPMIAEKALKYGVQRIVCEGTKATSSYGEGVTEEIRKRDGHIPVESTVKNWTFTGKAQRIFDAAPDIRSRMVFLEDGKRTKEYSLFMSNVYSFKFNMSKRAHDDAPDSLAGAIKMSFSSRTAQIIKRPW